jgi:hypothetical protein
VKPPGHRCHSRWLAVALTATAIGLAACGDEGGTTAAPDAEATSTQTAENGEPAQIKTRLHIPTGEVLRGSTIGDSPFCSGGTFRDTKGDTPERTFRCPDGSLIIGFNPTSEQPQSRTQAGPWTVRSGTGAYEGLRGGGRMKVTFEQGSHSKGRETFTGTVTR